MSGFKIFQFHKGTIRTIFRTNKTIMMNKFQFHKGTIRTLEYSLAFIITAHFNSIKVRLELWYKLRRAATY